MEMCDAQPNGRVLLHMLSCSISTYCLLQCSDANILSTSSPANQGKSTVILYRL